MTTPDPNRGSDGGGTRDTGVVPDESALHVEIRFHGPFRVGTGLPGRGTDDAIDRTDPLPGSSLKGLMRASAQRLLPAAEPLLDAVFGAGRRPSPWHWSSADFGGPPLIVPRARIRIDGATGTVEPGQLVVVEEQWALRASFAVTRFRRVPSDEAEDHLAVLACAAAGVHALGADRRRGLGWVTCTPTAPAVTDALLARFEQLRSRRDA